MYCRNCGKEIKDNTAFCPNCGTSVSADSGTKKHKSSERKPVTDTRNKREKVLSWELLALGILTFLSSINYWSYAMYACTGDYEGAGKTFYIFSITAVVLSLAYWIQYLHSKRKKTIETNLRGSGWLSGLTFGVLLISLINTTYFTPNWDTMFYLNSYHSAAVIIFTILLILLSSLTIALSILVLAKKTPTTVRKIVAAVIAVLLAIALCLITILPSMSRLNQPLYGNGLPKNRNINWGDSYDSVKNKVDGAVAVRSGENSEEYWTNEMRQDFWRTGAPAEITYFFGKDTQELNLVNISFKFPSYNRDSFEKLETKLLEKMEEQYGPSDSSSSGAGSISSYEGYGWHLNGTKISMLISPDLQTETNGLFFKGTEYYEIILIIHPQYR